MCSLAVAEEDESVSEVTVVNEVEPDYRWTDREKCQQWEVLKCLHVPGYKTPAACEYDLNALNIHDRIDLVTLEKGHRVIKAAVDSGAAKNASPPWLF